MSENKFCFNSNNDERKFNFGQIRATENRVDSQFNFLPEQEPETKVNLKLKCLILELYQNPIYRLLRCTKIEFSDTRVAPKINFWTFELNQNSISSFSS